MPSEEQKEQLKKALKKKSLQIAENHTATCVDDVVELLDIVKDHVDSAMLQTTVAVLKTVKETIKSEYVDLIDGEDNR
jgi:hypothetical protein